MNEFAKSRRKEHWNRAQKTLLLGVTQPEKHKEERSLPALGLQSQLQRQGGKAETFQKALDKVCTGKSSKCAARRALDSAVRILHTVVRRELVFGHSI